MKTKWIILFGTEVATIDKLGEMKVGESEKNEDEKTDEKRMMKKLKEKVREILKEEEEAAEEQVDLSGRNLPPPSLPPVWPAFSCSCPSTKSTITDNSMKEDCWYVSKETFVSLSLSLTVAFVCLFVNLNKTNRSQSIFVYEYYWKYQVDRVQGDGDKQSEDALNNSSIVFHFVKQNDWLAIERKREKKTVYWSSIDLKGQLRINVKKGQGWLKKELIAIKDKVKCSLTSICWLSHRSDRISTSLTNVQH